MVPADHKENLKDEKKLGVPKIKEQRENDTGKDPIEQVDAYESEYQDRGSRE